MSNRLIVPSAAVVVASVLWVAFGGASVVNYDTLYALLWGKQIVHGHLPELTVAGAPTPHPLLTAFGVVVSPILGSGSAAAFSVLAAIGYLATATAGVLLVIVGRRSVGLLAGVIAGFLLLTREPVLSYGVRAYLDLPYMAMLLGALALELRTPRAGWPVLTVLLFAGLLRPDAWLLAFAYVAWLAYGGLRGRALYGAIALAVAAPVLWLGWDLILTGDPLFSLHNTQAGAIALDRPTGVHGLVMIAPRRLGEILRWEGLLGAVAGCFLAWRVMNPGIKRVAVATAVAASAFIVLALFGLPVIVRYLLPFGAIGCLACGLTLTGWRGDRSVVFGRVWAAGALLLLLAMLALAPTQYHRINGTKNSLLSQQRTTDELRVLVEQAPCGPLTVPNRRAVPLLALWTGRPAESIVTSQTTPVPRFGTYFLPADAHAARQFVLDKSDLLQTIPPPPPGYHQNVKTSRWIMSSRCRLHPQPIARR